MNKPTMKVRFNRIEKLVSKSIEELITAYELYMASTDSGWRETSYHRKIKKSFKRVFNNLVDAHNNKKDLMFDFRRYIETN